MSPTAECGLQYQRVYELIFKKHLRSVSRTGYWRAGGESMMARVLHLSNLCIAALFIQQVVEHSGTTSQLPDEEGRERV